MPLGTKPLPSLKLKYHQRGLGYSPAWINLCRLYVIPKSFLSQMTENGPNCNITGSCRLVNHYQSSPIVQNNSLRDTQQSQVIWLIWTPDTIMDLGPNLSLSLPCSGTESGIFQIDQFNNMAVDALAQALCHQVISSHVIDSARNGDPSIPWGRI